MLAPLRGYKTNGTLAIELILVKLNPCLTTTKQLFNEMALFMKLMITPGYDAARTEHLTALGLTVIRFTNDEVLNNPQFVISEITKYLTPAPFSSQEKGRG